MENISQFKMLEKGHCNTFISSLEKGFNSKVFDTELGIFLDEHEDTDIPGEGYLYLEDMARKLNRAINKALAEKSISAKQAKALLDVVTDSGFDPYWFNVKRELAALAN